MQGEGGGSILRPGVYGVFRPKQAMVAGEGKATGNAKVLVVLSPLFSRK
jgi:hypothetical protein